MTENRTSHKYIRHAFAGLVFTACAAFLNAGNDTENTEAVTQRQAFENISLAQKGHTKAAFDALDEAKVTGKPSVVTCERIKTFREDFYTSVHAMEASLKRQSADDRISDVSMMEIKGSLDRLNGLMDAPIFQAISRECK